jgi:hypothetical protein
LDSESDEDEDISDDSGNDDGQERNRAFTSTGCKSHSGSDAC